MVDDEIVIVGAGVAGLYAGWCLRKAGFQPLILEASNSIGGRIQEIEGVLEWPVPTGPEFIHGANSVLKNYLEHEMGCQLREKQWPDWYYFGCDRQLVFADDVEDEVEQLHQLFADVGNMDLPEQDQSVEEWLLGMGMSDKMVRLAESCYANDFGCSLRQLGLTELILENRLWNAGETYLLIDRPWSKFVEHLAKDQRIMTNYAVSQIIQHSSSGDRSQKVEITGGRGKSIYANTVIITTSVVMLQMERIKFDPPLPDWKKEAINRVKMSSAVKVILGFSHKFWSDDLYDVVCTHMFIPEFWMITYPKQKFVEQQRSQQVAKYGVVGFIAGEEADRVAGMREADVVHRFLNQLDAVFGQNNATRFFLSSAMVSWTKANRYIGGAYSYPSFGAAYGDREALGMSVGGNLLFAGEATHPNINPCIQAAMETGQRAAQQAVAMQTHFISKL